MDHQHKNTIQSNRARQKNKRGDGKVESNDNPKRSDRGKTSDISGLPSGSLFITMDASVDHFTVTFKSIVNATSIYREVSPGGVKFGSVCF